jgi:hypothetical protein
LIGGHKVVQGRSRGDDEASMNYTALIRSDSFAEAGRLSNVVPKTDIGRYPYWAYR